MTAAAWKLLTDLVALDTKSPDIAEKAHALFEEALEDAYQAGIDSASATDIAGYYDGHHEREEC